MSQKNSHAKELEKPCLKKNCVSEKLTCKGTGKTLHLRIRAKTEMVDFTDKIHNLRELLHILEPGTFLWMAIAEERGRLLRRHFSTHLRWEFMGEPKSVMDL